jgi:hypothetical protein
MNITQIDQALADHFVEYKEANGGKKTNAVDKYSFKSLRYFVRDVDGKDSKYFLGRGSCINFYRKEAFKFEPKVTEFVVETVLRFKDKNRPDEVIDSKVFALTETGKKGRKPAKSEEDKIKEALEKANYVKAQAAKKLGVSADVLRNRIKKYGIVIPTKQVEVQA